MVPEIPVVAEQGFPGFDVLSWHGLPASAGTPRSVVGTLFKEVSGALQSEEMIRQFAAVGATPAPSPSPEELRGFLRTGIETWRKVIQRAKITVQ